MGEKINFSFLKNKYYVLLIFVILLFILKYPIMDTAYVDDEKMWYVPKALLIAEHNLDPIFRATGIPEEMQISEERQHPWFRAYISDFVHPPLFYEILAFFYLLFGYSNILTHIIIVLISIFAAFMTYLLGSYLYNERVGFGASLLLVFSPIFFSQAGRAYPDMLTAALGITAIYFALRDKTYLYILFGSLLVLTRETGILFIISILIYKSVIDYKHKTKLFNNLFQYGFPILILIFWYLYHYIKTGLFIYGQNVSQQATINQLLINILTYTKFLLVYQYRIILVLTIIFVLYKYNKTSFNKKTLPLILTIIFIIVFYGWANIMYLRHILPIFPLFFILATNSLEQILRKKQLLFGLAILVLIILFTTQWFSPTKLYHEENMRYLDVINTREQAQLFILENPESKFWVDGFYYYDLVYPFVGFVDKPLTNIEIIPTEYIHKDNTYYHPTNFSNNFKSGDYVLDSKLVMHEIRGDYQIIQSLNLELVKEIESHDEFMNIYRII